VARRRHQPDADDAWKRGRRVLGLGARDLHSFLFVVAMSTQTHATLRVLALVLLLGAALWPRTGRDGRVPEGSRMARGDVRSAAALAQNR
jgi:hypothetical protein